VVDGDFLFGKPAAKGVAVPQLAPDAFSRIVFRFQLGGQHAQIGAHDSIPHPSQAGGLVKVVFNQVFSCPAQLAGRKRIAGLCRGPQLRGARQYEPQVGSEVIARHNPELGITETNMRLENLGGAGSSEVLTGWGDSDLRPGIAQGRRLAN
jgi:hypothetical protein